MEFLVGLNLNSKEAVVWSCNLSFKIIKTVCEYYLCYPIEETSETSGRPVISQIKPKTFLVSNRKIELIWISPEPQISLTHNNP